MLRSNGIRQDVSEVPYFGIYREPLGKATKPDRPNSRGERDYVTQWVMVRTSILDDRAIEVRSPTGQRIFLLAPVSRLALGPTQPPIQWVPGVLSPGVKCGRGVTLTTHPHLVPRLRMSKSYISSPPMCLHGV
jgi:hypothetical protein